LCALYMLRLRRSVLKNLYIPNLKVKNVLVFSDSCEQNKYVAILA